MNNSANNLLKRILDIPEESAMIEFKRVGGSKVVSKIIETVVAMANTDGGMIILGVDDPEKKSRSKLDRVCGIEESKENFDEIFKELSKIQPDRPKIYQARLPAPNNKTIVILFIEKSEEGLLFFNSIARIRLEKGNKVLDPQEIMRINYAKGFKRADEEEVDVSFDLLDTVYYQKWRDKENLDSGNRGIKFVLHSKGLAKESGGILKPTRAAVLLFAEYPTNLIDTKCAVKVAVFQGADEVYGETPNMVGVQRIIQGPMIKLINETHKHVLSLLSSGLEITSGFRTAFKLPERAVKEGITNAIIHRDYYPKEDIEINIFSNRIEIMSPGLFPFNITSSNIGETKAIGYRNDSIVKALRDFPDPPNLDRNEGVRAMRTAMNNRKLLSPLFTVLENHIKLTLFNEDRTSEWEKVKKYLEENIFINNEKAREITGITQRGDMSNMLAKWFKKGLLIKITRGKSRRYTYYALPTQ